MLYSLSAFFLHALANAGEVKSNHLHARAQRAILVNARSERHFQTLSGYFGYCQISLNAEKIIIFPIFFYKIGVLKRLCCKLAICDKITRFVAFFLLDDFCRFLFQSLKSNKINFSLGQHVVQKVPLDSRKPF